MREVCRLDLPEEREQAQGLSGVMPLAMQFGDDFLLPSNPSITLEDMALRLSQMSQLPRTVHCDRLSGLA
jgi:hypothetical protein